MIQRVGEIRNTEVFISNKYVKEFIHIFVKRGFGLMWVHYEGGIFLQVEVGSVVYQVPFIRKEDKIIMAIYFMPLFHKEIYDCLDEIIRVFKGDSVLYSFSKNRIYESNYKQGILNTYKEFDFSGNLLDVTENNVDSNSTSEDEETERVLKLEIDYFLMELSDYIKEGNKEKIKETKSILKGLQEKLVMK